jgi:hypothetical protein
VSSCPACRANFIFGTDEDKGGEPVELTKEFFRRLPFVFPTINIPTPFGGTPLHERALREGRILEAMPFAFYFIPNLVMRLRNYDPLEYYDHQVDMPAAIASTLITMRRLLADLPVPFRLLHALRTIGVRQDLRELRCIRHLLHTDPACSAFHDGRSIGLPAYYRAQIRRRLGSYADLLSDDDLRPRLHCPEEGVWAMAKRMPHPSFEWTRTNDQT